MDEPINPASRTHEETVKDWDYMQAGKVLYRFYDFINDRFFGSKVPTPVLSFKYSRCRFGSYRNDRNESGLRENITFNIRHLTDPLAEVIETLAHEMVHSWQRNFGKSGAGNYHNAECRKKMDEIGTPCGKRGRSLGMREPFVSFLREQGIEADTRLTLPETALMTAGSGTRLKKWHCSCTSIWAISRVAAQCTNCGSVFVRA